MKKGALDLPFTLMPLVPPLWLYIYKKKKKQQKINKLFLDN